MAREIEGNAVEEDGKAVEEEWKRRRSNNLLHGGRLPLLAGNEPSFLVGNWSARIFISSTTAGQPREWNWERRGWLNSIQPSIRPFHPPPAVAIQKMQSKWWSSVLFLLFLSHLPPMFIIHHTSRGEGRRGVAAVERRQIDYWESTGDHRSID